MKVSYLSLLAFTFAFLPRLFAAIGAPAIVNFLHFPLIFLFFLIVKPWEEKELNRLFFGFVMLLSAILISAVFNGAGIVNIILEIFLYCEPFIFLLILISSPWSENSISFFGKALSTLCFFNMAVALFQILFLGQTGDDVKGVFIGMGAGHHVSSAISMAFGIYWSLESRNHSMFNRNVVLFLAILLVFISDSKQVLAVALGATILYSFYYVIRFRIVNFIKTFSVFLLSSLSIFIIGKKLYPPLLAWVYSSNLILGLQQKISVFNIISNNFTNSFCWLLGLGPGHTISRLAWLMDDYGKWLYPMGATSTKLTKLILYENQASWLSNSQTGSSLFSLMFSFAGIWGDIGIIGLLVYLYCFFCIFQKYCKNNIDHYWIFMVIGYGVSFAWLEEPGFMLFIMCLIGLSWQKANTVILSTSSAVKV